MTPKTASSVTARSVGGLSSFLSLILGDCGIGLGMVEYQEGRAGDEGLFTAIVCAGGAAVGAHDVGLDLKPRVHNIIDLGKKAGDRELERLVYQNGWTSVVG